MIWRSVVGKLWVTILLLVSVVLTLLTILLTQFFENFYDSQAKEQLTKMADRLVLIMEHDNNKEEAIRITNEMAEAYSMSVMIIDENHHSFISSDSLDNAPYIPVSVFNQNKKLSSVTESKEKIYTKSEFPVLKNGEKSSHTMIVYGEPYSVNGNSGGVYVYQSIENIEETTNHTKYLIFLAAGIAIILTTIFAFFLSTRITAPLRKMREAAMFVAKGEFDMKVPILTHDEIGELGMTFNRMGRQLKNNITALNQEKEQLASVLSSMADGVITFDRRMNILVTNPPADRFLQAFYYESGMKTQKKENMLPEAVIHLFQKVVSLEKEQLTEIDIQGRSWVVVMTPLYDNSVIRGAVAVLRDMTEERRMDKLREDFVANVSHELKTPLSMLQGYSEAIVDNIAESEEEKKELASIILDESKRMGRLVNELLDLAKLEAGHMKLHYTNVSLKPFVERIVRKFQGPAKERDIQLSLHMEGEPEELNIDPDRIEQVLTNLIDNAIRHTLNEGFVSLTIKISEQTVSFNVKDNGTGIKEEDLPFVFERFYKGDKARTRGKSGGTGLGLAIARNIVEAHGGQINVHSKMNEGTTFSFVIPRMLK
ncbi:ATP-binding protein [Fictibacillus barbaricus]|uniref:histidine kinase n=1 Tax=Fictibacillus barbaricus TaxID=182136 RepID=A0ABU1TZI8_9BACL|nr:ATP-binding protein [Fictibacillus barbaricus]MDR7072586.1 two-component system sensor histidine kinase ResE [Fictibacillus barbaricus]